MAKLGWSPARYEGFDAVTLGDLRGPDGRPPTCAAGCPLAIRRSGGRVMVNGVPVGAVGHRAGRYVVYPIGGVLDPTFSATGPIGAAAVR